ncbi:histidine-type phosphatase [Derxia gummosa]|uniref:Histidine-type phosphatase n=1 Tax=Derxia gummosa DSM 723 TaxID=1121388 RepID=A0A8B6XC06_9BURK|nr:histidine-type phosphatase [Derxia gummosa]
MNPSVLRRRTPRRAVLALAVLSAFSGCSSDDDGTPVTSGVVVGSHFRNALVCVDANANGACDSGEASARSDASGRFSLRGGGAIVAEIGTDASRIDPDTGAATAVVSPIVLRAPKEAPGVLSLHSTSVVAEMESNALGYDAALAKVAIAVGVARAKLLTDFNTETDAVTRAALEEASGDGIARIARALAASPADRRAALADATLVDRYYQTKSPYRPQQDAASYEAVPAGYSPVFTQLVARHGSRGLSSLKYDAAIYNLWKQAEADGALTDLGRQLGPDVLKLMKANFLLGYGVSGISTPGYGNETRVGIDEHTQLARRMLARLPAYWDGVAADGTRKIVTVTSGVDRAVDSGNFFVGSLKAERPALAALISYPPAPAPYPDNGGPVAQPAGTNRFLLYFHKLSKSSDLVSNTADAYYPTWQDSLAYQAYKSGDADLAAKQSGLFTTATARAAGRAALERLFTSAFVDRIEAGGYRFANTGSWTYTSDDGKFSSTLTGDGKTVIDSAAAAASLLYELYVIAPALRAEAGVDFTPYLPREQAKVFAAINDASDFYDKGPGITEKGSITSKMAQVLVDDLFNETDAIAAGDLGHAAKLRFAHAEIVIPLATRLGLAPAARQVPLASTFSYDGNPWRGETVSRMAANLQWDVFRNAAGKLIVRMLWDEKETDFKADCAGAKVAGTSHFYDYAALAGCYGHAAK